ncbi:cytochrome c [Janthinobacterium sp. PC23-8]|uniref:cytochrome c n=1 Tax=Janthinobacterium sp. PC23-8 TaxID=2012679 RepID=UPI000B97571C|nr:cytochrome c [Janthinobacterium sp. PC23-8]OYO29801.1 alcohol dehydrogenase [Janthinobacterium sp. PC23-8]
MKTHTPRWLAALTLLLSAGSQAAAADAQLIRQGEYLARAGDCIACHTAPQGKPYAGGLGMATPIGKIYSTNITPDKEHGIGNWRFEDFDKLMRTGVTKHGYTVYPAMPYPSYSRLSEADMRALYAYLMHGVAANAAPNRASDIAWPLSMRFPLTVWRWVFAPRPAPYVPAPTAGDPQLLRGAYLVQGLGHCGACHTARGVGLQEKALSELDGSAYLAGGAAIDGWVAPSLRNEHGGGLARWSEADIAQFLKTGRNNHSASFGAMNDVVTHSMQYMSKDDLSSIAKYLKSLPPANAKAQAFVGDDKVAKALFAGKVDTTGAQLYLNNCAGCHRSDGKGYSKAFPALAGNAVLQTADPTSSINIVLSGGRVPATHTAPSALVMGGYARTLNDQQIAEVVSFIQTSWGNHGSAATAAQVARLRKGAVPVQGTTAASFAPGRSGTVPVPPQTRPSMMKQ